MKKGLFINNEVVWTDDVMEVENPATKEIIGTVAKAGAKEASAAVDAAADALQVWKSKTAAERSEYLMAWHARIKEEEEALGEGMTLEQGKPLAEAVGEIRYANSFLSWYAEEGKRVYGETVPASAPNKRIIVQKQAIGVIAAITPWNFPAAMLTRKLGPALAAGCTAVVKPSELTPFTAYRLAELALEAGIPKGVINFVPGSGSEIGDYLIEHPKTSLISFTGSRDVGVRLYEKAAIVQKQQNHLKRVIVEMGGKDTVVVDNEADIETAVEAIVVSAFGFSGQKCSAGSRAVIHEDVYDEVVEKIVARTNELTVGNPAESTNNYMGPVIDQAAFDKITNYIEIGKEEGKLAAGGQSDDATGYFIHPTIFIDVDPQARIMQEEIFGPVLAISKASSYDEALEIANNTEYGLTGAVITNNREKIEQAKYDFHVGNLYFNRNCTGAIVGYHPFGGFKMSGTDSKAGGPDYLVLHMQAKTISEMY